SAARNAREHAGVRGATSLSRRTATRARPRSKPQKPSTRNRSRFYVAGGVAALVVAAAVGAAILLQQNPLVGPGAFTGHGAAFVGPDLHSILIDPRNPSHIFV